MTMFRAVRIIVGFLVALESGAAGFAAANCTVTGKFQYEDREFNLNGFTGIKVRPIRFADVRIMDGDRTLATGATKEDGSFSVTVYGSTANTLTAVCVTSSTATPGLLLSVRVANDNYSFGDYYSVASTAMPALGLDAIDVGKVTATADKDPGKFFNIWDVAVDALQFVASPDVNSSLPTEPLTVIWRSSHPGTGSFFDPTRCYLFINADSSYDDTVISHELGHFIDDLYSKSENPGGNHYLGDNQQDMRLSYAEGLATFLGSSIRKFKGYARPDIYVKTDGTRLNFSYEIESLTGNADIASKTGSTNEVAVTAALWDITDGPTTADSSPGTDDDPLELPFANVWKVLAGYFQTVTRPGISIENFWDGWFAPAINNGHLQEMQTVFASLNGIEFMADAFEPADTSPFTAARVTAASAPRLSSGANVVINEMEMGAIDALELFNAGSQTVDLDGWSIEASRPGYTTAILMMPAYKLEPGAFVVLSEAGGTSSGSTLYFGYNISWDNGAPGACVLKDKTGTAVDFVRWGGSTQSIPAGTSFAGPDPAAPPRGRTLARIFAGADTDSGADWTAQDSTMGTYNTTGQEKHHTFYPAADVDHAVLNATAGFNYLVESVNPLNGADTIEEILASDGVTVLASNDDYGTTKASRLVWTAPSSGTFFVRSRRYDGVANFAQYGSYDLRVVESPLPFGVAQPVTLSVSQPGQGGKYESLSKAFSAASSGDTVEIMDSGVYCENARISGKSITLKAAVGQHPMIDGSAGALPATLMITNAKTLRIDGLMLAGGSRGILIDNSFVTIANSVIAGASDASGYSDGIQVVGSAAAAKIINSTIVNNGRLGVGVFKAGSATIVNSIVRGNGLGEIDGDGTATSVVVRNSLLGGADFVNTNGNITGDPMFVDAANGDFRLQPSSPAIDKGDPNDPDLPSTDADGIPRRIAGRTPFAIPDIGAYEYLPAGVMSALAVLPQVAAGGSGPVYRTSIIGMNMTSVPALGKLSLTKSDATPFFSEGRGNTQVLFDESGAPVYGGSSYNFSVAPFGTSRLETASGGDATAGYATLSSNTGISVSALFKTVEGSTVLSEAGVGLSKPAKIFRIYLDSRNGAGYGYAVANYGPAQANLTLTLRDSNGNPVDTRNLSLLPGHHVAEFAFQRFAAVQNQGFEGSLEFSSDQNVAAVALRYDNPAFDVFSTIPVLAGDAAQALYFAQVADGGGYRTELVVVNPCDVNATATLQFLDDSGNPLTVPIRGVPVSTYELRLAPKGVAHVSTDGIAPGIRVGWARLTATAAVGGSALIQTAGNSRVASEAGVSSSPVSQHLATYIDNLGYTQSGLALCNPNPFTVTVTLKLRNSSGQLLGSTNFDLPPMAHVARFLSDPSWFPTGFQRFEGTLEILATAPICGTALRYDNPAATVFATLPLVVVP